MQRPWGSRSREESVWLDLRGGEGAGEAERGQAGCAGPCRLQEDFRGFPRELGVCRAEGGRED